MSKRAPMPATVARRWLDVRRQEFEATRSHTCLWRAWLFVRERQRAGRFNTPAWILDAVDHIARLELDRAAAIAPAEIASEERKAIIASAVTREMLRGYGVTKAVERTAARFEEPKTTIHRWWLQFEPEQARRTARAVTDSRKRLLASLDKNRASLGSDEAAAIALTMGSLSLEDQDSFRQLIDMAAKLHPDGGWTGKVEGKPPPKRRRGE